MQALHPGQIQHMGRGYRGKDRPSLAGSMDAVRRVLASTGCGSEALSLNHLGFKRWQWPWGHLGYTALQGL